MSIWKDSRYTLTDVVQLIDPVSGLPSQPAYIDLLPRVTATAPDDRIVTVDASTTSWARLAQKYLGDARHWWVVADLSGVLDPFTELTPGTQVRIPSKDRFLFDILTLQAG